MVTNATDSEWIKRADGEEEDRARKKREKRTAKRITLHISSSPCRENESECVHSRQVIKLKEREWPSLSHSTGHANMDTPGGEGVSVSCREDFREHAEQGGEEREREREREWAESHVCVERQRHSVWREVLNVPWRELHSIDLIHTPSDEMRRRCRMER